MIFGRHPAVWIGLIQAVLVFLSDQFFALSEAQIMGVVAVLVIVGDLIVAGFTKDTVLGALVGLTKALIAALVLFGAPISPDLSSDIIALLTTLVAFLQMNATSPLAKFSLKTQKDYAPAV
jgi:hypothetical protein